MCLHVLQYNNHQFCPKLGEFGRQFSCCLAADFNLGSCADRACVQAGFHLHDHDARGSIPRQNSPLNRCSATPAGQQRAMHVEATIFRCVQYRLRQNQTICCDNGCIEFQHGEFRLCLRGAKRKRAAHGQAQFLRAGLYGRRGQLLAPISWTRGLRIHRDNLMPGGDQSIEAWNSKFRCSHEGKTHRDFSFV